MNLNNYASLEASKRLYYSDIVLDTEMCWEVGAKATRLTRWEVRSLSKSFRYAAPSMAEVWRELPEEYYKDATDPIRYKVLMSNQVGYHSGGKDAGIWFHIESNPADAIIYLLIRVRKEASHEG